LRSCAICSTHYRRWRGPCRVFQASAAHPAAISGSELPNPRHPPQAPRTPPGAQTSTPRNTCEHTPHSPTTQPAATTQCNSKPTPTVTTTIPNTTHRDIAVGRRPAALILGLLFGPMQKLKRLRGKPSRAWEWLADVRQRSPKLFARWQLARTATNRPVGAV